MTATKLYHKKCHKNDIVSHQITKKTLLLVITLIRWNFSTIVYEFRSVRFLDYYHKHATILENNRTFQQMWSSQKSLIAGQRSLAR